MPGGWQVHNDVRVTEEDSLPFCRPSMACSIVIQRILAGSVAGGKASDYPRFPEPSMALWCGNRALKSISRQFHAGKIQINPDVHTPKGRSFTSMVSVAILSTSCSHDDLRLLG